MLRSNIPSLLRKFGHLSFTSTNQYVSTGTTVRRNQAADVDAKEEERWDRFQDMKYLAIVTRLKIYPALMTLVGTPCGFVLQVMEIHPEMTVIPAVCIGIVSTSILAAYSALLSKTIGLVEVGHETKNLKLFYIDFLGRQLAKTISIKELRKCEKSPLKFGFYRTVKLADDEGAPLVLKIPTKRCDIYDILLFKKLFEK